MLANSLPPSKKSAQLQKKLSRALAGVLSADGVIDDEPRTPQELVSRAKQWTRSKKGL
jgi:hypothetical protein